MSANPTAGLLPLSQRLRWTNGFRSLVVVAPLLVWWLVPDVRTGPLRELLVPAVVYGATALLALPLLRLGRGVALTGLALGLLLDGAYLGWAFLRLGGLDGPVGQLMLVHGIAVTLLLSFRTGLKLVLWQSMVVVMAVQVQVLGLAGADPLAGRPFPTADLTMLVAAMWAAVLATSTFAAVNERELRRRRYDVEVLLGLARQLESTTDISRIALLLTDLVHDELLAERSLVVVHPNARQRGEGSTAIPRPGNAVRRVGHAAPEHLLVPDGFPAGSVVRTAMTRGGPLLTTGLDPASEGWVAEALPGAANLLVVPFHLEHQVSGALLMAVGARRGLRTSRRPRIERRRVATAQQATAHAAQALGRAALFARLRVAADTDGLTGLANRRTFDRAMDVAVARGPGSPFAVLLVDLDHFKALNDRLGHQAGDDALRVTAALLQLACRDGDLAARYGGEEFAVVLPGLDSKDAVAVAERVREAVESADGPTPVTASIGVACFPEHGRTVAELVGAADSALYLAKNEGRNRVGQASRPGSDLVRGQP